MPGAETALIARALIVAHGAARPGQCPLPRLGGAGAMV